jgi:hypothetical protein
VTTACLNPEPRTTSRWQPAGDDHLIFQWVKMEGKTQSEVARMFGIDQSTVSRIIQRYERWQAHMQDRENGRLDAYERYRAQRWLTYERNELILASCLRIAGEMEGFTELSKSTIHRPIDDPSQQRAVRTEERVIDRHGVAARFLRLAFRVNMEQLDLVDAADDLRPDPLSADELAADTRQAAADAAEIAAARHRADQEAQRLRAPIGWHQPAPADADPVGWDKAAEVAAGPPSASPDPTESDNSAAGPPLPSTEYSVPSTAASTAEAIAAVDPSAPAPICNPQSAISNSPPTHDSLTHHSPAASAAVHNLHNENPLQIAATNAQPCTCTLEVRLEKNSSPCITCRPPQIQARSASEGPGGQHVPHLLSATADA